MEDVGKWVIRPYNLIQCTFEMPFEKGAVVPKPQCLTHTLRSWQLDHS